MDTMELRRVDSFKEISFRGERFKILSPSVEPFDLIYVESTTQGVAFHRAAMHGTLEQISQSEILAPVGRVLN